MTTETKLRGGLVVSILLLLWVSLMWSNSNIKIDSQQKTIDSLQNVADSLHDETFNSFTETGRYEMALEIYKEKNPKAVKEIEKIKDTQTE